MAKWKNFIGVKSMQEVVVGLDLHLKKTQGTVMAMNGKIVKQERFETNKEKLGEFLKGLPNGTKVALESVGFCWPWIDYIENLGHEPLLANPLKLKAMAEDVKTLVPKVKQSGERMRFGRETKANRWLKWALIEAAWSHINWCSDGRLAKVFENAYRRKKDKKKAIKIVARKLVNIVWAVWTRGKEFTMIPDKA